MANQSLARLELIKDKSFLNISDASLDDELSMLLIAWTDWVEAYTGRQLVKAAITGEKHNGDGTKILTLDEYPFALADVSSVTIWDGSAHTAELTTQMEVVDDNTLIYPKLGASDPTYSNWPEHTDYNIRVTYSPGYDNSDWDSEAITTNFGVPADLEYAVAKLAALAWLEGRGSNEGRLGKSGILIGPQQIEIERFLKGLPPEIIDILKSYNKGGF
jgi:hypothetical protein